MGTSVETPSAPKTDVVVSELRDILQAIGFVRLDGIEMSNGNGSFVLAFDKASHISGAWHYLNGIGMVVLHEELWFWVKPRDSEFEDATEIVCPKGQKGSMKVPITLTTMINYMGLSERLESCNWKPT